MKLLNIIVFVVSALVIYLHSSLQRPTYQPNSITFIVGDDNDANNPFYKLAQAFFLSDADYRTEIVTRSATSLEDIVGILAQTEPPQGGFWEIVNVVTHSSEFGLQMPLLKNGANITTKSWQELSSTDQSRFPKVIQYLHKGSLVTFWGCSLGNHHQQLTSLSKLFIGTNGPSRLRSPNKRLFFEQNKVTHQILHYYADEFSVYTAAKNNSFDSLTSTFTESYPKSPIHWEEALAAPYSGSLTKPSYDQTEIMIKFHVPFDILASYRTLHEFMLAQAEILNRLQDFKLRLDQLDIELTPSETANMVTINCKSIKHAILARSRTTEKAVMVYADAH